MVIVSKVCYPPESARKLAERFMNAPTVPDYIRRKGPYIDSRTGTGVSTLSIFELDKSRLAEGLEFVANYMVHFFGVPGFTYEIKPYFDVAEGLKMLGMS
jgi:hypothetical protein